MRRGNTTKRSSALLSSIQTEPRKEGVDQPNICTACMLRHSVRSQGHVFQRDLLYIIAGVENPHGITIADELADDYNKEIQHGRLYPNLDTPVNDRSQGVSLQREGAAVSCRVRNRQPITQSGSPADRRISSFCSVD